MLGRRLLLGDPALAAGDTTGDISPLITGDTSPTGVAGAGGGAGVVREGGAARARGDPSMALKSLKGVCVCVCACVCVCVCVCASVSGAGGGVGCVGEASGLATPRVQEDPRRSSAIWCRMLMLTIETSLRPDAASFEFARLGEAGPDRPEAPALGVVAAKVSPPHAERCCRVPPLSGSSRRPSWRLIRSWGWGAWVS
jgi:hypothetical protein